MCQGQQNATLHGRFGCCGFEKVSPTCVIVLNIVAKGEGGVPVARHFTQRSGGRGHRWYDANEKNTCLFTPPPPAPLGLFA